MTTQMPARAFASRVRRAKGYRVRECAIEFGENRNGYRAGDRMWLPAAFVVPAARVAFDERGNMCPLSFAWRRTGWYVPRAAQ